MSSASEARPSLLRRMNEQKVLEIIQSSGPVSRADVTRLSGISAPTVSKTVANLIRAGLVEEGEFQQAAFGRPGKTLRMATRSSRVFGLVVNARRCELVASGLDGKVIDDHSIAFATPATYEKLVATIADHAQKLLEKSTGKVLGVGVSIPGLLDRRERRTLISPNVHQTDGRQLGEDLRARLGLDVELIQESHALCLAERTYGLAKEFDDFAMIDLNVGLGLGIVMGGRQVEGHRGLAGEFGHITVDPRPAAKTCGCGNKGCLETVATDAAVAEAISQRIGEKLDIDAVVERSLAKSLDAAAELDAALKFVAIGLAAVVNVFNPAALFVYGRFFDARANLWDRLLDATSKRALAPSFSDCKIIRARGNKLQGAIAAIIQHVGHRLTEV